MSFDMGEAFKIPVRNASDNKISRLSVDILTQTDFFEGLRIWNMQPARLELRWAE